MGAAVGLTVGFPAGRLFLFPVGSLLVSCWFLVGFPVGFRLVGAAVGFLLVSLLVSLLV